MSDSDLSPVEDGPNYDESEEELSQMMDEEDELEEQENEEDEEEEEEFEDPYTEEDDYEDDYNYKSSKPVPKPVKSPKKSLKLTVKTPIKPQITKPKSNSKPTAKAPVKKTQKSVNTSTRPSRPSKLSQEITQEPVSSRPRRGKSTVNYNDEMNDDDLLEEDELEQQITSQPAGDVDMDEEEEEEEDSYEGDEDVITTPALEDLSDDGFDSDSAEINAPSQIPDLTKMTERQRAKLDEATTAASPTLDPIGDEFDSDSSQISVNSHLSVLKSKNSQFLSLSNNIKKRHVLTEEENQIRRAEIARKRKNLSEKKLEEEKQDTINKLLKRRAKTTRIKKGGPLDDIVDGEGLDSVEGGKREKPRRPQLEHKALLRWTSDSKGLRLGIPESLVKN
ncbi:hypothetical protein WICPIJ_008185 [Wickerhamomyces pijperi]|uniref:INO80 complex subunit B-like conserved region domain-containing protein n=1 Tax=Wickerhamomyces pijperi TaxID=599730 RepID=A0A9P8TJ14_WICPI|nr:hypothetical protein WICPIJ_008185 [Wickerhamomyces pijperi]